MKVVQVAAYYVPHVGGVEYCCENLSRELAARGHDVTVLTSTVGAGRPRVERTGRLAVRYLRGVEFAHTPVIPGLAAALLRVDRRALIHLHLSHVYTELLVLVLTRLRRMPYVAHFHMDVDVSGPLGFAFRWYKRALLPLVIRGAAAVVTLSEEQRDLVVRRYRARPEDVVVIPNGVGDVHLRRWRSRSAAPAELLFVGRFARQKNLPRLLRALPLMRHRVHLTLVGDGERAGEVRALADELDLGDQVTFLGRRDPEDLPSVYDSADVLVLPSDREGMPLVLLEAMANGLPVVASDVQGLREFVGPTGVLVGDPSPQTFAAALDSLVEEPERMPDLSARSRAFAESHAWSRLVRDVEDLYEEVLRAHR